VESVHTGPALAVRDRRAVARSHDLAGLVDVDGAASGRVVSAERAEVAHLALLPEECVLATVPGVARADHLAALVDRHGDARWTAERAQIAHRAVLPEEGMRVAVLRRRVADDLAAVIDGPDTASPAAERAQIGHRAVLPDEPVTPYGPRGFAASDHLAPVVDRQDAAAATAERAQLQFPPVLPDERATADDLACLVDVDGRARANVSDDPMRRARTPRWSGRTHQGHD